MTERATDVPEGWVTTSEAAARLGVKRATLYAYVSRGVLRSRRRAGRQESLFERGQVEALAGHTRQPGTPQPLLRFRSVATSVSSHRDGDFLYRGVPVEQVCAEMSVEEAAALVLGGGRAGAAPPRADLSGAGHRTGRVEATTARRELSASVRAALAGVPVERRVPLAVALLGARDPLRDDRDPDRVRGAVTEMIGDVLPVLDTTRGTAPSARTAQAGPVQDLSTRLFQVLTGRRPVARERECLSALVIALMDHGLTSSTIAARVAASTRASVVDCLAAAYATMYGPLHGAAPVAAHRLIERARGTDVATTVGEVLRSSGRLPGFGHVLYADEDPRAALVLERLWRVRGTTRLRHTVEQLVDVAASRLGTFPNVDLANAAVVHAVRAPPAAGEVVFQVARTIGVVAHVLEEYAEEPLRWRGRVLDP